ncbi:MAG TPA: hypothetical protein VE863_20540 [Pyrinomonadaceae bacterium]|nr:hypothetical protein [Pyrinomonadaceae bacterium]
MKTHSKLLFITLALSIAGNIQAQSNTSTNQITRPRTVVSSNTPAAKTTPVAERSTAPRTSQAADKKAANHFQQEQTRVAQKDESNRRLSQSRLRIRIAEAQRYLKARPVPTAMTPSLEFVTIAALLPETSQIHLIRVNKQTFLTKGAEISGVSTMGLPVQVRIVRANGVNTAVTIFDDKNRSLIPLVTEFPIERAGKFREMAYYTSAHPALLSADLMKAGQTYVNTMVDLAAKRLRERGSLINPMLVDVAKRLCVVEHVDHERFRNENRISLFEEIYTLYALNELDTYRYSVSSAGAGGMVQMIPWTYNLMRQRHPGVGLNPDFVLGMRNHGNALEAMLLYMQDTWNDLSANEDVQSALTAKQATPSEIIAAGYNSNAAKLPGYIRRAGANWRSLIPRETQMYLQIYQSLDALMQSKANHAVRK